MTGVDELPARLLAAAVWKTVPVGIAALMHNGTQQGIYGHLRAN